MEASQEGEASAVSVEASQEGEASQVHFNGGRIKCMKN